MVNLDWTLNADGQRYEDLMHEWTTVADGATNGSGNLDFRGFAGSYDVTVTGPDGEMTVGHFTVNPGTGTGQITIAINLTAPAAPAKVVATGGIGQVSLSWAPVAGTSSYSILRGTTPGGEGSGPILTGVVGSSFTDTTAAAGTTYYYQIVAVNSVGESSASAEAVATTRNVVPPRTSSSLWSSTAKPGWINTSDTSAVELGMKFQSDVNGFITGVRFYKSATSAGPYVADLWSADGTLLATATFTNVTKSGWQQVNFAQPIAIQAHTTYIASYHTNHGNYADDVGFFAMGGVNSGVLHGLEDGVDGANGVYSYGAGAFPSSSYQASNYWVDVVFASSNS